VSAHAFWRSEEEEVRRRSEWKEGRKEGRKKDSGYKKQNLHQG